MKAMCGACWIESSRDLTTGQPERRQRYACYSGGGGWEALHMSCNKIGGRPAKKEAKLWKRSHDVDKNIDVVDDVVDDQTIFNFFISFTRTVQQMLQPYIRLWQMLFSFSSFVHLFVRSFLFFLLDVQHSTIIFLCFISCTWSRLQTACNFATLNERLPLLVAVAAANNDPTMESWCRDRGSEVTNKANYANS